jgi:hypothetical protein
MGNESKSGESFQGVLVGGATGAVIGGLVTFALASIFADDIVLPLVMALQGAMAGAMGVGWAIAMQLAKTEDEQTVEVTDVVPVHVQTKGQSIRLQRAA